MKMNNRKLDRLISKSLKETLEEKADKITSKLKKNVNELGGMPPDVQDTEHPFYNLNASKMSKKEMNDLMKRHYGKENYFGDDEEESTKDWEEIDIKGMNDDESEYRFNDEDEIEDDDDLFYDEEEESEQVDEGFDSMEMKSFRKRKDYSPEEFDEIPLGKGEVGFDNELMDDDSGVDFRRRFFNDFKREIKRRKDFDDEYGDEEFTEGEEGMCEQCGGGMNEGECKECGYKMEGIYDVEDLEDDNEFDYVEEEIDFEDEMSMKKDNSEEGRMEKFCSKNSPDFDQAACDYHKKMVGSESGEMTEKLHGGQRKLDKNKNGRIDAADFKMLRAMKGKKTETDEEVEEGNAFTGALANAKKQGKDEFEVDGKKYNVTEGKHKKDMKEKWEGDVDVKQTGEYSDMSVSEIDSAIKKLKAKNQKAKDAGKKVPQADRTKMSQLYFAKRAKQGWKGKGKAAVKETIRMTESQVIGLIENVILEQKLKNKGGQPKGLQKYKQSHEKSGKENKTNLTNVGKKMKDYLKDGSKGGFDMNPKIFPMGNGELGEMKKKAYKISDDGKDFLNSYQRPGMENLDYDEIHPNEEWMKDTIEGSSRTGNNPKWANAVETDVNKNINKKRKENKYAKAKRAAFQKAPQPVINDKTGDEDGTGIHIKMESTSPKEKKKLNEEFDRMKNLIGYNRKTQ